MDGRVFEIRMAEAIQSELPDIAKQLKRIADALEKANELKTIELKGK